ncbi:uncharacterized protein LOC100907911 [Galendromus occidentalis]|uniref:Uncharacterized protein LOC100907911 n=1 Tax=Galendromus occidentalis TaxID=34638 RepID=A0AAJ6QZ56_9ACAR|nr:uncharacterized protein LOC100907911 [Galendromus occidentalis]
MTPISYSKDLPIRELVLLARHASRVSGFLTLKILAEFFPSLDMKTNLCILEKLLDSQHIRRTRRGYYTFVDSGEDVETRELKEELEVLANAKKHILERVRVNIPMSLFKGNGTGGIDMEWENNTRLKPPSYNVTFMPLEAVFYCILSVGDVTFRSYPTLCLTKKRATQVAAEKAVASFGITASMVGEHKFPKPECLKSGA